MELGIYDVAGRRVSSIYRGWSSAGVHEEMWETRASGEVRPGLCFVRLRVGGRDEVVRIAVIGGS
jgi:hypothetical protein